MNIEHESRDFSDFPGNAPKIKFPIQRRFGYGGNFLCGSMFPGARFFADPGLWCTYVFDPLRFDLDGGIVSSHPDIRGLPSTAYRLRIIKTYQSTLGVNFKAGGKNVLMIEGYAKWKNHCPRFADAPGALWWDENRATPLLARGVNAEWNVVPFEVLDICLIESVSKSERIAENGRSIYEWDMPWSFKAVVNLHNTKKTLSLFLTGVACKGLQYRDIALHDSAVVFFGNEQRIEPYGRIDIKLQFLQPIETHRFFTRFDAYLEVLNVAGMINAREYYWDSSFNKQPVNLVPLTFSIGLRLGFRL